MKTKSTLAVGSRLFAGTAFFAACSGVALRADDVNNFDAGASSISTWAEFDLTPVLHSFGIPGTYASYNFPSDGNGGKALEITTPTLPLALGSQAGPPRAFAFPTTPYNNRFQADADLIGWNNTINQAFGILYFAQNIGPGTTTGYVMNYNAKDGNLQINSLTGEAPNTIAESHIPLDPAHRYHWQLSVFNGNMLGRVFQLPDTTNPLGSVVVNDTTYSAGVNGLFNFDRSDPPYAGTDSTFDNYDARATAAGSLQAATAFLSPVPGSSVVLAQPQISVAVVDQETTVNHSSFALSIDGTAVPSGQLTVTDGVAIPNTANTASGATLTYTPAANLSAGVHTVTSVYQDSAGTSFTNTWSFTAAYLTTPVAGTPGTPGFNVFVVQAPQTPQLPNSLATADAQLAGTNVYSRLYATNVVASFINFDKDAFSAPPSRDLFGNALAFPGQIDANTYNNWAVQVTAYVQLPAGVVTLGVKHDDHFRVTYGDTVLGINDNGTGDNQFSFYVAQAGLYPLTLTFNQAGGAAYLDWYQYTPNAHVDTANEVLLNTSDAYPAYATITPTAPKLFAEPTLGGTPAEATDATYDAAGSTFTVSLASAKARYFRVNTPGSNNKLDAHVSGGNLVIHYTLTP
jgi:hypothetical protein